MLRHRAPQDVEVHRVERVVELEGQHHAAARILLLADAPPVARVVAQPPLRVVADGVVAGVAWVDGDRDALGCFSWLLRLFISPCCGDS